MAKDGELTKAEAIKMIKDLQEQNAALNTRLEKLEKPATPPKTDDKKEEDWW